MSGNAPSSTKRAAHAAAIVVQSTLLSDGRRFVGNGFDNATAPGDSRRLCRRMQFLDEVEGTVLGFDKQASDVLAEYADRHELQPAKERDSDDQCRESRHRIAEEQGLHEYVRGVCKCRKSCQDTDVGRDLERCDRETGDALECEVPELPVTPLAGPSCTRVAVVVDRPLPEADPGEQAFQDPVALRQAVERIERAPAQQTEVTGIDRDWHVAQAVHHAVEPVCRQSLEPVLPRPMTAAHVHDVGTAAPFFEHRRDQFWGILQVRVDDDRRRAMCLAETRAHRLLLAEVAAQPNRADARIEGTQLPQDERRAVRAAVVDVNDLKAARRVLDRREQAAVKLDEYGIFVAYRNDHAQRASDARADGSPRRRENGAHAKLQRRFRTKPLHITTVVATTCAAR